MAREKTIRAYPVSCRSAWGIALLAGGKIKKERYYDANMLLNCYLYYLFKLLCVLECGHNHLLLRYSDLFLSFSSKVNRLTDEVDFPMPLENRKRTWLNIRNLQMSVVLTPCANRMRSCDDLKNRSCAASLTGKLSYAVSSQLAISFLKEPQGISMMNPCIVGSGVLADLIVPIKLSTKNLYSSAGASSRALQTLL